MVVFLFLFACHLDFAFFSNLFTTQALFRLCLWYRNMTCVYLCWKRCYIFSSKDFFQLSVGVLCCDPFTWETGGKWIGAYCHTALCRKCGSALFSLLIEFLFGDKLNIHTIEVLQNSFLGQGHLFVWISQCQSMNISFGHKVVKFEFATVHAQ